ncbi:hypothetical protein HDU98_010683 [Podochytrium sp. JEL0797]|nr:hypothetical protein HDU98_010683 [Podochytrium sp. JEL0797]
MSAPNIQSDVPTKRTVAIAVDQSQYAEFAFEWGLENQVQPTDLVVLLNARPQQLKPQGFFTSADAAAKNAILEADSQAILAKFSDILAAKQIQHKTMSVPNGKEALVQTVDDLGVAVLIVGSRGLNVLSRSLLGSVSDYCAHYCSCPVVIVKPTPGQVKNMSSRHEA